MAHVLHCIAQVRWRPVLLLILCRDALRLLYQVAAYRPYLFLRKQMSVILPFRQPKDVIVASPDSLPDYFVFGVIDWHFRHQRPQHLSQMLAHSGRRVFYVSSNFRVDRRSGFEVEPLGTSGNLFSIKLFRSRPSIIYSNAPAPKTIRQLRSSMGLVLEWARTKRSVCFVQHAFWYEIARSIPDSRLVYDLMDSHEGFGNSSPEVIALEEQLLKHADITVATSAWLGELSARYGGRSALIRNACEYELFSRRPEVIHADPVGRRIIGYYGAIAGWLDLDLVEATSRHFPDCCILLIGADTIGAQFRLAHLENVVFIGEVRYELLPFYLHAFDVALLPFKIMPLTLATNPIKIYEYLAAGKPVVSVGLPETAQFGNLIRVAKSDEEFLSAIFSILSAKEDVGEACRRQDFAAKNTWSDRTRDLAHLAEDDSCDPRISVIVITYNNLDLTRACLQSLDTNSHYGNMEIVVVDNASSDGTREFLSDWVRATENRKILLNESNRGFPTANNQGIALADGEYLVLLNNDTFVTPGWLRTLYRHFRFDPSLGLIGPVTNRIGNQAEIDIRYETMEDMVRESRKYTLRHMGETLSLRTVAFFCVMMPRRVMEQVGLLDEAFGLGFFEDDDYCRRVEQCGYKIACAEDVFVHHHLSASFLKMEKEARRAIYRSSKSVYEKKWGKWEPHAKREKGLFGASK
ncbi:MAG TPA: glycosyltransferase [Rhodocyclaceae bacterium]|nr:glycosyltransferase [Rhodocyclaceae bacterium]